MCPSHAPQAERVIADGLLGQVLKEHLFLCGKDPRGLDRQQVLQRGVALRCAKKPASKAGWQAGQQQSHGVTKRASAYVEWMKDQHLTRPSGRVDLDSYHAWQGSKVAEWKHVDESVKELCAARSDANACKRRRAAVDAAAESLAKPSFRPTSRCLRTFIDDVGDAENFIKPELFMATAKAHAGLDPNAPDPGFCTASESLRRYQLNDMVVMDEDST